VFFPRREYAMNDRKPPEPPEDEKTEETRCDELLDDALEDTFPASDPPAIAQPPAKDC